MELTFRNALLIAGAFLLIAGLLSETVYLASNQQGTDLFGQFSYGMSATVFSLFSGVLIGAGLALVADSAMARLGKFASRAAFTLLLMAAALCIAVVASSDAGENQIVFLLAFFISVAAFLALLLSLIVALICCMGGKMLDTFGCEEEKGWDENTSERKKKENKEAEKKDFGKYGWKRR
ncbi:MAG: hypothetical protein NT051_05365 [Candidatus Micrarchaeota archaeon]|nr:hypothetical protein [Candidatus Micrarchaeota archaeon]